MRRLAFFTAVCAMFLPSCAFDRAASDPSIAWGGKAGRVQNGIAYERATTIVDPKGTLVVPDDATVQRRPDDGCQLEVYVAKELGFTGYPPRSMSIADARKNMGCASREEGGKVLIATYGEWGGSEGGTAVKLVVRVPRDAVVERRAGLSGEASLAQQGATPDDAKGGYWYGPSKPADGWKALLSAPDPDRVAAANPSE